MRKTEKSAKKARSYVQIFTLIAFIASIQGIGYMIPISYRWIIGFTLLVIGISWGLMGLYFHLISTRFATEEMTKEMIEESVELSKHLTITSIVVVVTAFINLFTRGNETIEFSRYQIPNYFPQVVSLAWLIGATLYLFKTWRALEDAADIREEKKLPEGKIEYTDTIEQKVKLLISKRYKLSGRPDIILERDGHSIPVEIKTGRVPKGPFFSHILQLAAYCTIIEDNTSKAPPYGIIRYGETEFEIPFDKDLKDLLFEKVDMMRNSMSTGVVHRNHHRVGKCTHCSRRKSCPERLE